jgi:hypothetical protein
LYLGSASIRPEFLGDSYDIVKRFFCEALRSLGYTVYIDPLLTGDWSGQETTFDRFLGAEPFSGGLPPSAPTALFLDPDTGVNEKGSSSHVSFERLVSEAKNYAVVFAFDQAFSRAGESGPKLHSKLNRLTELGCAALYYSSHAHFLFVSEERDQLHRLRGELLSRGIPASRFVEAAPNPTSERDPRKSSARSSL